MEHEELVKENRLPVLPLTWHWLAAGLALSACAVLLTLRIDHALPAPLPRAALRDNPERFIAEIAHEHLVNLTAIGPRVAGSYENEVAAVALLVRAVRGVAAAASRHNRVELDVQRASGNFSLTFMDGMNNVYRDVQSVVARVSGAGAREPRAAILLNCHFDTVPDSPGASDDGAGCAVLLETMRALAASRRPLRHDAIFLFNGAEENIMQASHAFITQHKWARAVRAFINIEACGAGGREVMFQAGPHDPWIVEVYAGAVPHPFASSLAQELFESGLIPADTDFRIFRDFGKLSGVDLAWNANGYVYHTRLDTAAGVPAAALQRTGDNVLALLRGLLAAAGLRAAPDAARPPAYFDVLGLAVLAARAPAAAALAAAAAALVLLKIHLNAQDARRELFVSARAWWARVLAAGGALLLALGGGVLAAAALALALHAAGARLSFYSRPALLAPLYVAPGAAACWALASRRGPAAPRGWWAARAWHDAGALLAGAALLLCAARGLRSGFLPLLWALLPAAADVLARAAPRRWAAARPALWLLGAALPLLQTTYLLGSVLRMFVPLMGRAGSGPLPSDLAMAVITSALALSALSWLLPYVVATRNPRGLVLALAATGGATALLVALTPLGAPYGAATPQRLMLFHTRRTLHAPVAGAADVSETFYWVPELDANTRKALDDHVSGAGPARGVGAAECARWLYCGAPYFLPVLGLVRRSHALPARDAPLVRLHAQLAVQRRADGTRALLLNVTRAPAHVVLVVAPAAGARLLGASAPAAPLPARPWGARSTYFVTLHAARAPAHWALELRFSAGAGALAAVSLAGHAMFGAERLSAEHARALHQLPPHVAGTGWGVDLHLYDV